MLPTQYRLLITVLIFLNKLDAKMSLWVASWPISDIMNSSTLGEYLILDNDIITVL